MSIFTDKHILLGVTGSIAAYKAAELASKLTQAGAKVDVLLTPGAEKFVTPLTFQSVTGRKAFTDADLWGGEAHVLHVGLGHGADLLAIARHRQHDGQAGARHRRQPGHHHRPGGPLPDAGRPGHGRGHV